MDRIEVPKETPTEFELRDTAADIQRRWEEREQWENEEAEKQQRGEARRVEERPAQLSSNPRKNIC